MNQPAGEFHLRPMQPSDSDQITQLITEFDGDLTTHFMVDAYTAITNGTKEETIGVVVECSGPDHLVGMGTVRFNTVQFNGTNMPLAFLDGLKVHQDFRGRGLGFQIAQWRIQQARERFGDQCVIGTGLLQENMASRAVAKKWCRDLIEPANIALILPVRSKAPKPISGLKFCELEPPHFEEFSTRQNRFFSQYNLYPPVDAASIASTLETVAEGKKPYRYYCVMDSQGNLLAGARVWARGLVKTDQVNQIPTPLRLANHILHVLPSDSILREIGVTGIWYEPGRVDAARLLWEMMRFACSDLGNLLAAGFDIRDPAQEVLNLKPWHQPRLKITLAIHGPTPIDRDRLVFSSGRI